MRDLQHRPTCLVNAIQRVIGIEIDSPAGYMLDRDHVVAEDHLWRRNAQLCCHLFNGLSFQNWELSRYDLEALLGD